MRKTTLHRTKQKRRGTRRKKQQQRGGAEQYTAVILEPRKLKVLRAVLRNFLENLDSRWTILFFHGTKNKEFVERIIREDLSEFKNRIQLRSLNRENLGGEGGDSYNQIMMSREILDQIPTEMFLVFQADTVICSQHKDLLEKFLTYDYVGAPWSWMPGGNGGLSLRRKSKMLEIVEKCKIPFGNEDMVFSQGCGGVALRMPSKEEAKEFSIETMYSPKSWGMHKSWGHLPQHDAAFKQQCKDYQTIKELQGATENS